MARKSTASTTSASQDASSNQTTDERDLVDLVHPEGGKTTVDASRVDLFLSSGWVRADQEAGDLYGEEVTAVVASDGRDLMPEQAAKEQLGQTESPAGSSGSTDTAGSANPAQDA